MTGQLSEPAGKNGVNKYLGAILLVGGWLLGAGMQYGIVKADSADTQRRLETLERQMREDVVPRKEYESWQKDLRDRLDAIDGKLDRNFRSGGKQ